MNATILDKDSKRAELIRLGQEICSIFERIHVHMATILERADHLK